MERFREEDCTNTDPLHEIRKAFTIPHSITGSMNGLAGFAPFLILILTASLIGSEYGWGTLRTTLTRGAGRWQLLGAKIALVMLASAAAYVIVAIATALASLLAAVIPSRRARQPGRSREVVRSRGHLRESTLRRGAIRRLGDVSWRY